MKKQWKAMTTKMSDLAERTTNLVKKTWSIVADIGAGFLCAALVLFIAVQAPQIHNYYIRSKVGSKVYKITGKSLYSGGTGFQIKASSGTSYIVTNAHVCEVSPDGKRVMVSNDDGLAIWRNIEYVSEYSDLCLIQGLPGVEGLTLGSAPGKGQIVEAVGHPSLMPITVSKGEVIGAEDIYIPDAVVVDPKNKDDVDMADMLMIPENRIVTPEQCSLPKNEIKEKIIGYMWTGQPVAIKICYDVTRAAYLSNMVIQPGNSGSPVVNMWGDVVGVVFAGDRAGWGIAVSFQDLKQLLNNY